MRKLIELLAEIKNKETRTKKEEMEEVIFEQCKSLWEDAASCEAPNDCGIIESYMWGLSELLTEEKRKELRWMRMPKWEREWVKEKGEEEWVDDKWVI